MRWIATTDQLGFFFFFLFFLQNNIFNGIFVKQNVLHNIPAKLCKIALDKLTKNSFIIIRTLRFPYGTTTIHLCYNK